jgi:hypothetical protein
MSIYTSLTSDGCNSFHIDVRFGSKADMCGALPHVRFAPESDIKCDIVECPLWAKSRHVQAKGDVRFGPAALLQSLKGLLLYIDPR